VTECNSRGPWPAIFLSLVLLDGESQSGGKMFAAHATTVQALDHARVALAFIAVGIVVFWRLALRLLLAVIVLAVGAGLAVVAQNMHH
jgi:hypothetical protein